LASRLFTTTAVSELSTDYALVGEWETAHTYARQGLAARDNTLLHGGLNKWLEIEVLLRAGDVALAREEVQRFGARFANNRRYQIPYRRMLAVLARWEGEIGQAIAHLQEALSLAEEIALPGERWSILAKLGELYQEKGAEPEAKRAYAETVEIVQALVNKIEDEELQKVFLGAGPVRQVLARVS
jgi:tetratricopeptide (TPR) repeat protein